MSITRWGFVDAGEFSARIEKVLGPYINSGRIKKIIEWLYAHPLDGHGNRARSSSSRSARLGRWAVRNPPR